MTETETDQLEVPDESIEELERHSGEFLTDADQVRAIAAPVVAAELRKWAYGQFDSGSDELGNALERRATDLDGGSRG